MVWVRATVGSLIVGITTGMAVWGPYSGDYYRNGCVGTLIVGITAEWGLVGPLIVGITAELGGTDPLTMKPGDSVKKS